MPPVLEASGVTKIFRGGDGRPITVLAGVDMTVERGEFVAIVGESGAGKSTLLHILGALDRPTEGDVSLEGINYHTLPPAGLASVRNGKVGFVFQFHHLLREFSALENVMMPMLIRGDTRNQAQTAAAEILGRVGLDDRLAHRPGQLSGGEQQRVALARAVVNDPAVILADEPSGNLDHRNSELLHDLLHEVVREQHTSLIVVTHDRQLAGRADRIMAMEDGALVALAGVEAIP
ncbi:MAG: ABC transporter ATP-binding protein [Gemmatimonadales bacterium]